LFNIHQIQQLNLSAERKKVIDLAREGGSITPEAFNQLSAYEAKGRLNILSSVEVLDANENTVNSRWTLNLSNQKSIEVDAVWISTGM